LGGRPVRTKRKDPSRRYGCKGCYEDLAPEKVRTTPYLREYAISHPCFRLISNFHVILVYTSALPYFSIPELTLCRNGILKRKPERGDFLHRHCHWNALLHDPSTKIRTRSFPLSTWTARSRWLELGALRMAVADRLPNNPFESTLPVPSLHSYARRGILPLGLAANSLEDKSYW
jgi:hypothetical protein